MLHLSIFYRHAKHTSLTNLLYDQSTSNRSSFKYSFKVIWSNGLSVFLQVPLSLSPGVLIIPPVYPPHRDGGFSPSDKVSRSFYKLIRVCSLWSRQLWTQRIDLAGESAVPDHDFKQNPVFLPRGRPSPEQYYPSVWPTQSEGWGSGWGWRDGQEVPADDELTAEVGFSSKCFVEVKKETSWRCWMWWRCWIKPGKLPGGPAAEAEPASLISFTLFGSRVLWRNMCSLSKSKNYKNVGFFPLKGSGCWALNDSTLTKMLKMIKTEAKMSKMQTKTARIPVKKADHKLKEA